MRLFRKLHLRVPSKYLCTKTRKYKTRIWRKSLLVSTIANVRRNIRNRTTLIELGWFFMWSQMKWLEFGTTMTFLAIRLVACVLWVLNTIYGTKCIASGVGAESQRIERSLNKIASWSRNRSRNYELRLWLQLRLLSICHKLEEFTGKNDGCWRSFCILLQF